jgi:DNA repair exonuclease SbcCD ATPase subunit
MRRKECGGISELSVKQLAGKYDPACPVCGQLFSNDERYPLLRLAEAIDRIEGQTSTVKVEFVIPDKS